MKNISLDDSGSKNRSVTIHTRHGNITVYCNSDYVAVELLKPPVTKEKFQPIFLELNGSVFDHHAVRVKLRRKASINGNEMQFDPAKKALADEYIQTWR